MVLCRYRSEELLTSKLLAVVAYLSKEVGDSSLVVVDHLLSIATYYVSTNSLLLVALKLELHWGGWFNAAEFCNASIVLEFIN